MKDEVAEMTEGMDQYLTFMLDGEEYGINILKVMGIQGWQKTTMIPNAPSSVVGLINLRGEVVPIVYLRKHFNLSANDYHARTVVIIVRVAQPDKERTVGLVVDAVSEVYNIESSEIRQAPEFGDGVEGEYIKGLVLVEEKMVILLEIDRLIDWGRLPGGASGEGEDEQQEEFVAESAG